MLFIDDLVQDSINSVATALELLQFCNKPSTRAFDIHKTQSYYMHFAVGCTVCLNLYHTLAREIKCVSLGCWENVFRTLELTATPSLSNQVKTGHVLDQSRSAQ